jgi:hypothetical protein
MPTVQGNSSSSATEQKLKIKADLVSLYENLHNHPAKAHFEKEVRVLVRSNTFAKTNNLPVSSQQLAFYFYVSPDLWLAGLLFLLFVSVLLQNAFVLTLCGIVFLSPIFFFNLPFVSTIKKMLPNNGVRLAFPTYTFVYKDKYYHMPRPSPDKIGVLFSALADAAHFNHYWEDFSRREFPFLDKSMVASNCDETNFVQYCSDQLVNYHWLMDFMDQIQPDHDAFEDAKAAELKYLAEVISISQEQELANKTLAAELRRSSFAS